MDARCDLDVVLAANPEAGFGHLFATLLFGLDLARKFANGRLLLADNFWDGWRHGSYPWAWELLRPAAVAASSEPAPAHVRVVDEPVTFNHILANWTCNTRFNSVMLAHQTGCYDENGQHAQYCHCVLPGALDRGSLLLPSAIVSNGARRGVGVGPVTALWHLRTGDVTVPLLNASFQRIKAMLDAGFPQRRVVHRAMTERGAGALHRHFPFLRESGVRAVLPSQQQQQQQQQHPHQHQRHGASGAASAGSNATARNTTSEQHALSLMREAHVLISTGSSFSLTAAILNPPGQQIHLCFPPKFTVTAETASGSAAEVLAMRRSEMYRTQFLRKNTIPLDVQGRPVVGGYAIKMRRMMEAMDRGVVADEATAMMAFESWL